MLKTNYMAVYTVMLFVESFLSLHKKKAQFHDFFNVHQ